VRNHWAGEVLEKDSEEVSGEEKREKIVLVYLLMKQIM
jgi:hypothetical protein